MRLLLAAACLLTLPALAGALVEVGVHGLWAPPGPPSPAPEEVKQLYAQRCAPCHGAEGRADGVLSATLTPPPADLSQPALQAGMTDASMRRIVLHGGAAVGKSPRMPPHPDLAKKPEVLDGLLALVRGFGRRGTVRAELWDPEGRRRIAHTAAPPDREGRSAILGFEGIGPGKYTLRGYYDEDESGTRGPREQAFEVPVHVQGEEPLRLRVSLTRTR